LITGSPYLLTNTPVPAWSTDWIGAGPYRVDRWERGAFIQGAAFGGFAYLALANTAVAYGLWFHGLERLSATAVSFLTLLVPIVATVIGYAVLDQTLSGLQIFGMFLAAVGLVGGQLATGVRERAPA